MDVRQVTEVELEREGRTLRRRVCDKYIARLLPTGSMLWAYSEGAPTTDLPRPIPVELRAGWCEPDWKALVRSGVVCDKVDPAIPVAYIQPRNPVPFWAYAFERRMVRSLTAARGSVRGFALVAFWGVSLLFVFAAMCAHEVWVGDAPTIVTSRRELKAGS